MQNIQFDPNPYSSRLPAVSRDSALAVIMGGSSTRLVQLENGHPTGVDYQISWDSFLEERDSEDPHIQEEFITFLADEIVKLRDTGLAEVDRIGISVAAYIAGDRIYTHNTKVPFESYPFLSRLKTALAETVGSDDLPPVTIKNDGLAATEGEYEAGLLAGTEKLIFMIGGTGVGGAGLEDGIANPLLTEFGHILRWKSDRYFMELLPDLEKKGLFKNGRFEELQDGSEYFEHRVAGPFVSLRFLRQLAEKNLLSRAAEILQVDVEELDPIFEVDLPSATKKLSASLVYDVVDILFSNKIKLDPELEQVRDHFRKEVFMEWGKAVKVLHQHFPEHCIVLGSGLIEFMGKDPAFLETIKAVSGLEKVVISNLTGEERESIGATKH